MTTIFDEALAAFRSYVADKPELAATVVAAVDWTMPVRQVEPRKLACLRYLDRIAAIASVRARPLARMLAERRDRFSWGQTYTASDFGQDFIDNYGWLELFGTRGHFDNAAVAGGVLLLGPQTHYPDHHHLAEEIYIPLTGGSAWSMGGAPFGIRDADIIIHHRSNVDHAMKTGAEPLLALYLWRGGPLAERSTIKAGTN